MIILNTCTEKYRELERNRFIFFKWDYVQETNDDGEEIYVKILKYCEDDCKFYIDPKSIDMSLYNTSNVDHILFYVGNAVPLDGKSDQVKFSINQINLKSDSSSWIYLINNFIYRSEDVYDKFPFLYLTWSLNYCVWQEDIAITSINKYNKNVIPYILKTIGQIGRCLSYNRQKRIKNIFTDFEQQYTIYAPEIIYKPLKEIIKSDRSILNENIFSLVKYFFPKKEAKETINIDFSEKINNPLKKINDWLKSDDSIIDYTIIPNIFPILSEELQHNIIKRYFFDIKNKKADFDPDFIKKLKKGHETKFSRYRFCLYTPNDSYSISVPLLCDCLLTLKTTGGKSFQTLNGILDLAIHSCDVRHPKIDLRLKNFLPQCHGGAVCNNNFTGFIDFKIGYQLKTQWKDDSFIQTLILEILKGHGRKKTYDACSVSHDRLSEDQAKLCNKNNLQCSIQIPDETTWLVKQSGYNILKRFMTEKPTFFDNWTYEIKQSQISGKLFLTEIEEILDRQTNSNNQYLINPNEDYENQRLLLYFLEPSKLRVYPKRNVIINERIDLFNLQKNINALHALEVNREALAEEGKIIYKRVVSSLEKELKSTLINDEYFEVEYSSSILNRLKNLYYCFSSTYSSYQNGYSFLRKRNLSYPMFCAPKIADTKNPALDLPFLWCRGKECFQNELSKEVLHNNNNWEEYTILHFSEILGFPMVLNRNDLYETSKLVSSFISMCNEANKTFTRLQCRSCKHLIFPDKGTDFNRYNHFTCVNPNCKEYKKVIYLSYCYNCKKGLIDSRDSAKCPNGWYICPVCNSCCNDALYDRKAQFYILTHRPIPAQLQAMLGHGHNDKGIYFCHICGTELVKTKNERGDMFFYCPKCKIVFNEM